MNDQLLLLVRVLQHHLGAVHVGLDRVHRLLDDQLDADGGGEMKDDVAAVDQLGQQRFVRHRVDDVLEAGRPLRCAMLSIEPVDRLSRTDDLVAVRASRRFGEVGSDEPGAAGDQVLSRVHVSFRNGADRARATRSMSSSASRGYSGSENSSRGGGGGNGALRGWNAANAGCCGSGTG